MSNSSSNSNNDKKKCFECLHALVSDHKKWSLMENNIDDYYYIGLRLAHTHAADYTMPNSATTKIVLWI